MNTAFEGDGRYPEALEGPFAGAITSPQDGSFLISQQIFASNTNLTASGTLLNKYLTIAAVPEPTSWMLFLGGFAFVGTCLRRRPEASRIGRQRIISDVEAS